ncbi:hypothetical protein Dsin_002625, partial [Dipteronia sinensis]
WLKIIIVTTQESDGYYHYKDNKVFPSHVNVELANLGGTTYKSEYIINELNNNLRDRLVRSNQNNLIPEKVIHSNVIPGNHVYMCLVVYGNIISDSWKKSRGGKKVTRVEVTMCTWHAEKSSKYDKYWCWCFWSPEVEVLDLLRAQEIAVRAWDKTLSTQPEKLIGNEMMNNYWFRVKTNYVCKRHKGEIETVFEHPTQPGQRQPVWWMDGKEKAFREIHLMPT